MKLDGSRTMFDDLREKATDDDFFEETEDDFEYDYETISTSNPALFLGMTPIQRLVIAVMILLMACVMGSFLLLVTEKVFLPFA
jgi:hypothetical protein